MTTNGGIPIIGQATVTDWFIALQVKCTCGNQFQLHGQIGAMRVCGGTDSEGQKCQRVYRLTGLPVLQDTNAPGLAPAVLSMDGTTFSAGIAYCNLPQQ